MAAGERQRENWVADICGALKMFANVARIRSDAFWFSAMR
jgi:hypothetical protein